MKNKNMLALVILIMSIGFAAVSTTLIINSNTRISENEDDFSVTFTAASLDGKDVYDDVIDDTKKVITFETSELKTLNQTSILEYTITNNSSIYDAEVKVTCVPKDGATAKYTSIKNELEGNADVVKAKKSVNGTLTTTLNKTSTEEVSEEYTCTLEFNATERTEIETGASAFEKNSWETIKNDIENGNTSEYKVGDTKTITLSSYTNNCGTIIKNTTSYTCKSAVIPSQTVQVRIMNTSACTTERSETACGFVFEIVDIIDKIYVNSTATNVGGWNSTYLKLYLNDTIYSALPSDLQNVITTTKIISGHGPTRGEMDFQSSDKIYLFSPKEIWGENSTFYDSSGTSTRQLDYYKNASVTLTEYSPAIKTYQGTNTSYWLRTAAAKDAQGFCNVSASGKLSYTNTIAIYGISPAFKIS